MEPTDQSPSAAAMADARNLRQKLGEMALSVARRALKETGRETDVTHWIEVCAILATGADNELGPREMPLTQA